MEQMVLTMRRLFSLRILEVDLGGAVVMKFSASHFVKKILVLLRQLLETSEE